jgi:hypothetical protein
VPSPVAGGICEIVESNPDFVSNVITVFLSVPSTFLLYKYVSTSHVNKRPIQSQ